MASRYQDTVAAAVQSVKDAAGKVQGRLSDFAGNYPKAADYLLKKYAAPAAPAAAPTAPLAIPQTTPNSQQGKDQLGLADPTSTEIAMEKTIDTLLGGITKTADSMMKGELPAELQDTIISQAAEKGLVSGLGETGSAVKSLTLRDLGINSVQYMQAGADLATKGVQLAQASIQLSESYRLNTQNLLLDTRKTDISAASLMESFRQFNKSFNLDVGKVAASISEFGMQLGFQYSTYPQKGTSAPDSVSSDITNMLADVGALKI